MKVLLSFLILVVFVVVCDENDQESINSNMRLPGYEPGYPVAEQGYPGGEPGYPGAEPENGVCQSIYPGNATDQIKYWRLFFEGPDSFSFTPPGLTNITGHRQHTCSANSIISEIVENSRMVVSKRCNGPVAGIGAANLTINGGTGYLYIRSSFAREINLNGNTIVSGFGQVSQSNPASCTGTYYLRITIYKANDQLECTTSGLRDETAIFGVIYFYGSCATICDLKTGSVSFNPPISITGVGPAKQLP